MQTRISKDKFIELYVEKDMSLEEIAKKYHRTKQRIHQIKKEIEAKHGKITKKVFIDPATLKEMIDKGKYVKEIASIYHTSEQSIYRMIKKYKDEYENGLSSINIKQKRAKDWITKNKLKELYQVKKKTDKQIGEEFGYSASTINALRKQYGIPSIKTKKLRMLSDELTKEKLKKLLENNKKLKEIAKEYQCSVKSIIDLKKKYKMKK